MKKIIRLTESDLARIVRRVISEDTETTKMTPITTEKLTLERGEMVIVSPENRFVTFTLTPKLTGDILSINISTGVLNTGANIEYDCAKQTFNKAFGYANADNLKNYKVDYLGYQEKTSDGVAAAKLYEQGMDSYVDTKKGQIGQLITTYCPKPKV